MPGSDPQLNVWFFGGVLCKFLDQYMTVQCGIAAKKRDFHVSLIQNFLSILLFYDNKYHYTPMIFPNINLMIIGLVRSLWLFLAIFFSAFLNWSKNYASRAERLITSHHSVVLLIISHIFYGNQSECPSFGSSLDVNIDGPGVCCRYPITLNCVTFHMNLWYTACFVRSSW